MTGLQIERITAAGFADFGKVVRRPEGDPTASGPEFEFWADIEHYGIDGETEIGYCTVNRLPHHRVEWMERHHNTPEILVPIDGAFLLPVMEEDAPTPVRSFRVDVGEAVVLNPGAWHSACIPADRDAISYFVIFRRGTPQSDVEKRDVEPIAVAT